MVDVASSVVTLPEVMVVGCIYARGCCTEELVAVRFLFRESLFDSVL